MKTLLTLLNITVALTLAPFIAHAAPRQFIDATGVTKSVVPTLVLPAPGLSEKNVRTIIESNGFGIGGSTIPPGYKEVQVPMSVHGIGYGDGAYGLSYYAGLGYPVVQSNNFDCQGNLSPRVLTVPGGCVIQGDGCVGQLPASYSVCEPLGTRYSLEKIVGGDVLNVTLAMLDRKTIPPAIGLSNNATTAYCQSMGYVNYVPGTVVMENTNNCSWQITRWNGSKFYNDSACYNSVLKSLQCFK